MVHEPVEGDRKRIAGTGGAGQVAGTSQEDSQRDTVRTPTDDNEQFNGMSCIRS